MKLPISLWLSLALTCMFRYASLSSLPALSARMAVCFSLPAPVCAGLRSNTCVPQNYTPKPSPWCADSQKRGLPEALRLEGGASRMD